MNIVHFIPNNSIGGLQNFCLSLAKEQSIDKQVCIYHFYEEIVNDNVKSSMKFTIKDFFKLLFVKKKTIFHTHGNVLTLIGFLSMLNKNLKIVHTVHNEARFEAGSTRSKLHSFFFKHQYAYPIVISKSLQSNFKEYYGFLPFSYVLNGIAGDAFDVKPNQKDTNSYHLLFLGRLDYQKNINLLLEAVNIIKEKKLFPFQLHIAGKDLKIYDATLFDKLCADNTIIYYGLLPDPTKLFEICDCICFSSIYEGMPIAAIEAKLASLQLVSVDVGGIKDIIEDKDVIIPKESTPEDFANAIVEAYSKRYLKINREIDFSITRVKTEYNTIYEKIMYSTDH